MGDQTTGFWAGFAVAAGAFGLVSVVFVTLIIKTCRSSGHRAFQTSLSDESLFVECPDGLNEERAQPIYPVLADEDAASTLDPSSPLNQPSGLDKQAGLVQPLTDQPPPSELQPADDLRPEDERPATTDQQLAIRRSERLRWYVAHLSCPFY